MRSSISNTISTLHILILIVKTTQSCSRQTWILLRKHLNRSSRSYFRADFAQANVWGSVVARAWNDVESRLEFVVSGSVWGLPGRVLRSNLNSIHSLAWILSWIISHTRHFIKEKLISVIILASAYLLLMCHKLWKWRILGMSIVVLNRIVLVTWCALMGCGYELVFQAGVSVSFWQNRDGVSPVEICLIGTLWVVLIEILLFL